MYFYYTVSKTFSFIDSLNSILPAFCFCLVGIINYEVSRKIFDKLTPQAMVTALEHPGVPHPLPV